MLYEFLISNREALIELARARVALRESPKPSSAELENGIPVFLDQLGDALRREQFGGAVDHGLIKATAGRHGRDLLSMGLTIAQVVHDYGDVCQAVTELAVVQRTPIPAEEFRTLNLCLDDAIAEAVTQYAGQRERRIAAEGTERLGVLAHELRNLLSTATLAFESIRSGRVAIGGSTGLLHSRALAGLTNLVDRSLADVRLDAGIHDLQPIAVADLVEEVEIGALLLAQARRIDLAVPSVDRTVTVAGDRQILVAALANLLHNAFKFTPKGGCVSLTTRTTPDRVIFDIEDECGGLPPGAVEDLFKPFEQRSGDRSGVGLGLSICLKAAAANGGALRVVDLPGKGCRFSLELPRVPTPPLSVVRGEEEQDLRGVGGPAADASGSVGARRS